MSSLYMGEVMHRRVGKVNYRFVYKVFSLYLDLGELPALSRRLRLFSYNRFNLFSFYDRDHGPRDGSPLRPWLDSLLRARGIELAGGKVQLLCFPRILGYGFNPLSVWYCHHAEGDLRAIVCEVRNTFGGIYHYVLADGAPLDWRAEYRARKVFHVSPFVAPDMEYRFRFLEPGEKLGIYICEYEMRASTPQECVDDAPLLRASITGKRRSFTDARLGLMFVRLPLMTLIVMLAIHWQALKIWRRGGRFHRMPTGGIYRASERVTSGWTSTTDDR